MSHDYTVVPPQHPSPHRLLCTHMSLVEVDGDLTLISDLRKHGGPHEQVREAIHVQVDCTQGGAEVRAHLKPSRHDNMFRVCPHTPKPWFHQPPLAREARVFHRVRDGAQAYMTDKHETQGY